MIQWKLLAIMKFNYTKLSNLRFLYNNFNEIELICDKKGTVGTAPFLLSICLYVGLNLSSLTNSVAEIVKLSAANLTLTDHVNLNYVRRVNGESLLNAATVCDTANGEGLGDSTAVTGDNSTFVHLDSLSCSLFDSVVYANGITNVECGNGFLKLLVCKSRDLSRGLLLNSMNIRASMAEDCSVLAQFRALL